jgi:hypothetical protein
MQIPQVCVGIKGRLFPCTFKNASKDFIEVKNTPPHIKFIKKEQVDDSQVLWFEADAQIQTPTPYLSFYLTINKTDYEIPMRIFGDREFFVVFVLQSNVHEEWNPRDMRGFYINDPKLNKHSERRKMGLLGPGIKNHAFLHHIGDEEELSKMPPEFRYKPLESILHGHGFPITWLIDQTVALSFRDYFIKWHQNYRDTMGYLPPSYTYHNTTNYNTAKSLEETIAFLHQVRTEWDAAFSQNPTAPLPIYARFCGIDQWVGSVGTNWIDAAETEGLEGIWGMGWDHRSCDTSMFHRGAPWNAYKPSKTQFRCVKPSDQKRTIWAFQWTVRDLVNTLPLSPFGSVCFSTDMDDIRGQKILYLEQSPTYFWKLLQEYHQAMVQQDFGHFIFLIHQEDHDAHFKDNNEFMERFASELKEAIVNGAKITLATLEEITAWLNLRYAPEENNWQYIEVHDPLKVETRAAIQEKYFHTVARIYDPEDEEEIEAILNQVYPADKNLPTTAAYFDETCLWLTQCPRHLPNQYYDYKDPNTIETKEDGELPMIELPQISNLVEEFSEKGYHLQFTASKAVKRIPWTIWLRTYEKTPKSWKTNSVWKQGAESIVFCIDVKEGINDYWL